MKIQILTDKNSWIIKDYKLDIVKKLENFCKNISFIYNYKNLKKNDVINIILSYSKIIPKKFLKKSLFNLVIHESNLPKGKGMSPLTWQILQGKTYVFFTLFNATSKVDNGKIYYKKKIFFSKDLIFDEIKKIQFSEGMKLILKFIKYYKKNNTDPKSQIQTGKSTYFRRRDKNDSKLNLNLSLKKQFNLLRINDNHNYPSFFNYLGEKYIIRLYKFKK